MERPKSGSKLTRLLRDRIASGGPLTFAEFMEAALYHPEFGYYTRSAGAPVDYFTGVTAHPVFGAMLANHLDDLWLALGRPDPFHVIELGAGDGRLAGHIRAAAAEFPWGATLDYTGVEISAGRRRQNPRSGSLPPGVHFVASIEDIRKGVGDAVGETVGDCAVISNEYFDALPFHLLRRQGDRWIEEQVDIKNGDFAFVDAEPGPSVRAYAEEYGAALPDGGRLEARPGLPALYSEISKLGSKLTVTTIDYGGPAESVHGERMKAGTALTYRDHHAGEDLLAAPGQQDLTAHVNFTALIDAGRACGLDSLPLAQQAAFLTALGIGEYLPSLQTVPGVTPERYERERHAILQLLDPVEMGRFRVLLQHRGLDPTPLRGPLRGFQHLP